MGRWAKEGVLLFISLMFAATSLASSTSHLKDIRFWTAPDHTRIVLDVTGKGVCQAFWLKNPCRLVIDIKGIKVKKAGELKVMDRVVRKIRWAPRGKWRVRVVLELYEKLTYSLFYLRPFQGASPRYVVDILRPARVVKREKEARELEAARVKKGKNFVVVIDPGHGGDDPGAIHNGVREKDVVLSIARKVKMILNATPGYRAYLTRKGDYYVSLSKRVEIAQDYKADLFISIHCNAAPDRRARGMMVFSLSSKGATDSVARMLARIENTSDMMEVEFSKKREVNYILLDLAQDYSASESRKFARIALHNLVRETGLPNGGVKKAGFTVLKNPGIPSVLVEVGFLSNRREARLVKSNTFRVKVAHALAKSVETYFRDKSKVVIPRSLIAKGPDVKKKELTTNEESGSHDKIEGNVRPTRRKSVSARSSGVKKRPPARRRRRWVVHIVRRGDTLWGISKRYGVKIRKIMVYNGLKRDKIIPGQRLRFPLSLARASAL